MFIAQLRRAASAFARARQFAAFRPIPSLLCQPNLEKHAIFTNAQRSSPRRVRQSVRLLCAGIALLQCAVAPAYACDICAIYTATEMQETRVGLRLGIAEQFSRFTTLQRNGQELPNPDHERLDSSITQFLLGYTVHPRWRAQLHVPVIYRAYRRRAATGVEHGDVSGLGDISLVATGLLYDRVDEHSVLNLSGVFGIKLPTGSTHRLREELPAALSAHDDDTIAPISLTPRPHPYHSSSHEDGVESGVHGHDLTLGSGSTDVVLGAQLFASRDRFFFVQSTQFSVRTRGAYGYTYADELLVQGGPGFYAWVAHSQTLGVQAVLTCDSKGTDALKGVRQPDTGYTALYAGPGISFTLDSNFSLDVIADIPAIQNNSALQLVPDFRIRGGAVWRF